MVSRATGMRSRGLMRGAQPAEGWHPTQHTPGRCDRVRTLLPTNQCHFLSYPPPMSPGPSEPIDPLAGFPP